MKGEKYELLRVIIQGKIKGTRYRKKKNMAVEEFEEVVSIIQ